MLCLFPNWITCTSISNAGLSKFCVFSFSILRKDVKDFSKESAQKNDEKILKLATEKAMTYFDNQDLPSSWERDELLGTDEEENSDDDEVSLALEHYAITLYNSLN